MYNNVTEEFNNIIKDSGRTFKAKLVNGADVISDVRSFTLYKASNNDENVGIGGGVASYIECKIGSTELPLENTEYELQVGLQLSDDSVEYIPIGLFTPKKPTIQNETTSFVAYDRMYSKFSSGYFSDIDSYPADGKTVLSEIADQTGCPIDVSNLPDGVMIRQRTVMSETEVDEDGNEIQTVTYEKPFTGYTHQEAICYIAQLYGKFATVDRNGTVVFRWFETTDYRIERNMYFDDMERAETEFVLGVIQCTTGNETFISGAGATGISIENPIMTQTLLDNVYNIIGGFKCWGTNVRINGDIRLDLGDIVQIKVDDETYIDIPIMRMETTYDGGIVQKIYAYGPMDGIEEKKGPTAQRLDRMYTELLLVKEIVSNKVSADSLEARVASLGFASIKELMTEAANVGLLTVEEASVKYANIDFSNVKVESVGQLLADAGLIEDLTVVDGKVTGFLSSVKINADVIEAGTLSVERLLVTGKDSIVYQINVNSSGLSQEELSDEKYQKYLNGTDIVANSITATQIAASSITAKELNIDTLSAISANLGIVTAGIIRSRNYVPDSTGMELDLSTGIWNSKNFKLSEEGFITANRGMIGPFTINDEWQYLVCEGNPDLVKIGKRTINYEEGFISLNSAGYASNSIAFLCSEYLSICPNNAQGLSQGTYISKDDVVTGKGVSLNAIATSKSSMITGLVDPSGTVTITPSALSYRALLICQSSKYVNCYSVYFEYTTSNMQIATISTSIASCAVTGTSSGEIQINNTNTGVAIRYSVIYI